MGESISEYMKRRAKELARFGQEAEAAAHEAYGKTIRAGQDLKLSSPGEVMRHGAGIIQERADRAGAAVSSAVQQTRRQAAEIFQHAGRNPVARSAAVGAARVAGNAAGVVRGGVHAVEGLADGAVFAGRLLNPLDRVMSPRGQSAEAQLGRATENSARAVGDYVRKGVNDPNSVLEDIRDVGRQWNRDLNPGATPVAPTFAGELRRNFDIGQNQGELAFDVGSLFFGGPGAKLVEGVSRAANLGNDAKYLVQGLSPKVAAYLAEPYPASGMGSHNIPRRTRLPESFGGGPLPKSFMDGPFNRLAPPGISRGDMYELHYKVDPRFNVARLPRKVGGGVWHGGRIGLERYSLPGRLWHGAPAPLKARVGGLGASAGAAMYVPEDEGGDW
ncbi:MAG TPA: hypothetical protein VJU34_07635 [Phenylobacterium sp.]|nr:hypothetical protein [Phenylobacterium sp.]